MAIECGNCKAPVPCYSKSNMTFMMDSIVPLVKPLGLATCGLPPKRWKPLLAVCCRWMIRVGMNVRAQSTVLPLNEPLIHIHDLIGNFLPGIILGILYCALTHPVV